MFDEFREQYTSFLEKNGSDPLPNAVIANPATVKQFGIEARQFFDYGGECVRVMGLIVTKSPDVPDGKFFFGYISL